MEQVSRWSQFNFIVQDLRSTVTDPDGLGAAIKIGCAPFDDPPKDLTQVEFEVQPEYEHLTFREQQKVLASGRSLYRAVVTSKENPNKDIQSSAFWFCLAHSALG